MKKPNWSNYQIATDELQKIFENLIGNELQVEALLVSSKESKDFTEYIFIYNHPTEEMNNLVSFYGKVDNKKAKNSIENGLIEFASAQFTEKMILRILKDLKTIKEQSLEESVASSIQHIAAQVLHNQPLDIGTSYAAALKIKGKPSTEENKKYFLTCQHCCNNLPNGYKLSGSDPSKDLAYVTPPADVLANHQNEYKMGEDSDCDITETVGKTIIFSNIDCNTKMYVCDSPGHSGSGIIKNKSLFLGVHQGKDKRIIPSVVKAFLDSKNLELW